jgi:hypothetical protein
LPNAICYRVGGGLAPPASDLPTLVSTVTVTVHSHPTTLESLLCSKHNTLGFLAESPFATSTTEARLKGTQASLYRRHAYRRHDSRAKTTSERSCCAVSEGSSTCMAIGAQTHQLRKGSERIREFGRLLRSMKRLKYIAVSEWIRSSFVCAIVYFAAKRFMSLLEFSTQISLDVESR